MANSAEARKIMTKPLPQILDEIEDSIRLANEAAKNVRDAAETSPAWNSRARLALEAWLKAHSHRV